MRKLSWKKALIGAAVLFGCWYVFDYLIEQSGIVPDTPQQLQEREELEADQLEENAVLYKTRDEMQEATEALRQRDYRVAARHFREVLAKLDRHARVHGSREAQAPGQFASDRDELVQGFLKQVEIEFRELLDRLVTGRVDPETVEAFVDDYNSHVSLVERYAEFRDEICAARARAAPRWLRIILPSRQSALTQQVREVFDRKWIAPDGYQLVFGEPLSELEAAATWKRLKIMYVETTAWDAPPADSKRSAKSGSLLDGPSRVELRFLMTGETNVLTTWDQIGPFVARRQVHKRPTPQDVMSDRGQQLLWQQLYAKLETVRPFKIFPGVSPDSLRLVTDSGDIREADAYALHLLARDRLDREIGDLLASDRPQVRQSLRRLIITLELDSFADWLTTSLEDTTGEERDALQPLLRAHPWIGDYEPILKLASGVGRTPGQSSIGTIRSQLPDPALRKRMLNHINDPADPNRSGFARFYIESVGARHLEVCMQWILDKDLAFAMTAYDALQRRDAEKADAQLLRNYDQVAPNLRARMIATFWYNPGRHGAHEIAILLNAAKQTTHERLSRLATDALKRAVMHPLAWDAYRALGRPADDVAAYEYDSMLAQHVRQAHPQSADNFLLGLLFRTQAAIDIAGRRKKLRDTPTWLSGKNRMNDTRNQVVALLLDGEDDKRAVVEAFLDLSKRYTNDADLRREILLHLNQRKQARGLPYDSEEMKDIILFGMRSDDGIVRERAYDISAYALGRGHADYFALLQQALSTEESPELRIKLQRLLRRSSRRSDT